MHCQGLERDCLKTASRRLFSPYHQQKKSANLTAVRTKPDSRLVSRLDSSQGRSCEKKGDGMTAAVRGGSGS